MSTAEIKAKEQELIQEINSDMSLLESALEYVRELKDSRQRPPCQYTVDELKGRLKKGRIDARNGVYKTQSEMRSKHVL